MQALFYILQWVQKHVTTVTVLVVLYALVIATFFMLPSHRATMLNLRYQSPQMLEPELYQYPNIPSTEEDTVYTIFWEQNLPRIHPANYVFFVDDCVQELVINSVPYSGAELPFCLQNLRTIVPLGPYLQPGINTFEAQVYNVDGLFKLQAFTHPLDAVTIIFHLLFLTSVLLAAGYTFAIFQVRKRKYVLYGIVLFGILLRIFYVEITPVTTRALDVIGQIEYVMFAVEHMFSIAKSIEGGHFFHPPLYYWLAAMVTKIGMMFAQSDDQLLRFLQWFSLVVSIVTLLIFYWFSGKLFTNQGWKKRAIFMSIIVTQPALLFVSSAVTNDGLLLLLELLSVSMLYMWWNTKNHSYWYVGVLLASLAIFTKTNAALLMPIFGICLLCTPVQWLKRLRMVGVSSVIVFVILARFVYLRIFVDSAVHLVGNIQLMHEQLRISNALENYVAFNPLRLLNDPFIRIWSEESGRSHLWEYMWRTAFIGELPHLEEVRVPATIVMFMSFVLLLFGMKGLWHTVKMQCKQQLPLLAIFIVLLLGHVAFRAISPFTTSQNVRYSLLLLLPCAYFVAMGIEHSSLRLRRIGYSLLGVYMLSVALFIASLGWNAEIM